MINSLDNIMLKTTFQMVSSCREIRILQLNSAPGLTTNNVVTNEKAVDGRGLNFAVSFLNIHTNHLFMTRYLKHV